MTSQEYRFMQFRISRLSSPALLLRFVVAYKQAGALLRFDVAHKQAGRTTTTHIFYFRFLSQFAAFILQNKSKTKKSKKKKSQRQLERKSGVYRLTEIEGKGLA